MGLVMFNISLLCAELCADCDPRLLGYISIAFRELRESSDGGSDDSHVSLHLLDHRIEPAAQHLLGETEGEPLDGVEG